MKREEFKNLCLSVFEEKLSEFGFEFRKSWSRPRGVVVQFCRNSDMILFAWEEGELVSDLILFESNAWRRISINQLLWFYGTKEVLKEKSPDAKLAAFSKEFSNIWSLYLDGSVHVFPERCTYEMDQKDYQIYIKSQGLC